MARSFYDKRSYAALSLFFLIFFFLPAFAPAQEPNFSAVREVSKDDDKNLIPDRLGETVALKGVITWEPSFMFSNSESRAYLQDDTGGIRLVIRARALMANEIFRGDIVEVRGKIGDYRRSAQLEVDQMRRIGSGEEPQPLDLRVTDLLGKQYSGRLVRLRGRLLVPQDLHKDRSLNLEDGSGRIRVYMPDRFFRNLAFAERLVKGGNVEVVGIAGQFDSDPTLDSSYRIRPRDTDDFHFSPTPPYKTITGLLIAVLGSIVYLWEKRRRAERRTQEMKAIVESLKQSEEALKHSEKEYRSLIEGAPYGIYRSSLDGKLAFVNPALVEMLGYKSKEELYRLDIATELYVDPAELARTLEYFRIAQPSQNIEVHWKRKDRTPITVRLSGRQVPSNGEPGYFEMIAEDLTTQRSLEHQLRHAQKMAAVARLAGGIAHDFNNLLTIINGYAELLRDAIPEGGHFRDRVQEIIDAGNRASNLTRQLLAFSRKQVLAPENLNLNDVVANTERMLRRLIGEDVELITALCPGLPAVRADRGQIEQVIMNLTVNARDAMPHGGRLSIKTDNASLDKTYAHTHPEIPTRSYVMLEVSDNGCGMDSETKSHLFEPFFTTKEPGKGTGLGLATIYGIVEQSGGHIDVQSEVGLGTTFRIYLPARKAAPSLYQTQPEGVQIIGGKETVLLVEDEEKVRALAKEALEMHGYDVLVAGAGEEAIRLCEKHLGQIHLTLTDVVMPGMSGSELAHRLWLLRPDMKVLYMSGYTDDAVVRLGVLGASANFLSKPFTQKVLARKVREVLDDGKFTAVGPPS